MDSVKGHDSNQRKLYSFKEKDFLSKEMISCQSKWFPVKGNDFWKLTTNLSKSSWIKYDTESTDYLIKAV